MKYWWWTEYKWSSVQHSLVSSQSGVYDPSHWRSIRPDGKKLVNIVMCWAQVKKVQSLQTYWLLQINNEQLAKKGVEGLMRSIVPPGLLLWLWLPPPSQITTYHCTNDRVFEYYPLFVYECVRVVTVFISSLFIRIRCVPVRL